MSAWLKLALCLLLFFHFAGCASSAASAKRPAQPIKTLAAQRGHPAPSLFQGAAAVGQGIWKGGVWLVGELLRPVDALRKGFVHLFGVTTEEAVVEEKNLPPRPRSPG